MNWMVDWLLTWILEGIGEISRNSYNAGTQIFEDPIIVKFMEFFSIIGGVIYAISILIALFAVYERVINQEQPNWYNFGKNLMLSTLLLVSAPLVEYVYSRSIRILQLLLVAIDSNYADPTIVSVVTGGNILTVILVVVVFIGAFVTFFGSLKRSVSIVIYAMCIYCYIPGVMLGNYGDIVSWLKQVLAIILTQIIQVCLFSIAVVRAQNMLIGLDFSASIVPMALFISLTIVPTIINAMFNGANSNKGGALGFAMQAAQMGFFALQGAKGGKGEAATTDTTAGAATQAAATATA
jgi:hypothetical protein